MANREKGHNLIGALVIVVPQSENVVAATEERCGVETIVWMYGSHSKRHRVVVPCVAQNWKKGEKPKAFNERGGHIMWCCRYKSICGGLESQCI
jgi:hypothetical protein